MTRAQMTRAQRIADHAAQLPPPLRAVLDHHLAAGNELVDVEVGRDARAGRVVLVMNHPFRRPLALLPAGVGYRETLDREPMLFEYHTLDERWSLLTAKLKPIVFERAAMPPDAAADYVAGAIARQDAEAMNPTSAVAPPTPPAAAPPRLADPSLGEAANRFLASMTITYEMWHDGAGYDLAALARVPTAERASIEATLLARRPPDWRDVEALARFDTLAARAAVLAATKSDDASVRRQAIGHVPADAIDPADREARLLAALKGDDLFGGLSQAIDEAAEFHPPAVVDALLRGTLNRPGQPAVLFAALLCYLHDKADAPFDWSHRPFFLRFDGDAGRAAHHAAFRELCATLDIDPAAHGIRI